MRASRKWPSRLIHLDEIGLEEATVFAVAVRMRHSHCLFSIPRQMAIKTHQRFSMSYSS
jgi:hypothetical protein